MSTSVRPGLSAPVGRFVERRARPRGGETTDGPAATPRTAQKAKLFVAAENRLLREALAKMLAKRNEFEIVGLGEGTSDLAEELVGTGAEILLFSSRGALAEDMPVLRAVRFRAPQVRVLLIGVIGGETEFLQCVRAGVSGYLPRDASSEEVLAGVRAVSEGGAVCSRDLCMLLFRYFESEAGRTPSATVHERLGFTRREQQIIPLIAEGFTNKEIASHFCLSEQTVKNHLYRMKQKAGAGDRLGIVRLCRTQGFFL
jgi:two-component system nitrate/nitrite response regulator NarL